MTRRVVLKKGEGLSLSDRFSQLKPDAALAAGRNQRRATTASYSASARSNIVSTRRRGQQNGLQGGRRGGPQRGRGGYRNQGVLPRGGGVSRRGRGRGRGGGRGRSFSGRGGRGRRGGKKTLSAEALNSELDKYMMKDKDIYSSHLDDELDSYMAARDDVEQEQSEQDKEAQSDTAKAAVEEKKPEEKSS